MTDLSSTWLPPEAYPAVVEDHGAHFSVSLPDFKLSVTNPDFGAALAEAEAMVFRHLRQRANLRQLVPFASSAESAVRMADLESATVVMISTAGWDRIEEAEDE